MSDQLSISRCFSSSIVSYLIVQSLNHFQMEVSHLTFFSEHYWMPVAVRAVSTEPRADWPMISQVAYKVQHRSSQLATLELHPLHASPTAAATALLSSVSVPPPSAPVSPQLAQPGVDFALSEPDLAPPPAVTGLDCPAPVLPESSDVPSVSVLDQPAISPAPPVPIHPMTTRFRDGIQQPKVHTDGTVRYPLSEAHASVLSQPFEPTCFTQAVKHSEW
ncbi:hypothetical protein LWI28_012304 [Acer negundo]|uniref:Uncharacterized protein n=1 Tax=Acer negundo TaxID=4023 RepID=A0AAD5IMC7_ACENE|nr:hypothetical protein LWI28_012304 [Acer negundo]